MVDIRDEHGRKIAAVAEDGRMVLLGMAAPSSLLSPDVVDELADAKKSAAARVRNKIAVAQSGNSMME